MEIYKRGFCLAVGVDMLLLLLLLMMNTESSTKGFNCEGIYAVICTLNSR